jgi:hypothetical protein
MQNSGKVGAPIGKNWTPDETNHHPLVDIRAVRLNELAYQHGP